MDPISTKLLEMATAAQGDRPTDTSIGPMDPERRKWLEEAMKSMTYDVPQKMKDLINIISCFVAAPVAEKESEVATALEDLEFEVQRADAANDMEVLGGYGPVVKIAFRTEFPRLQSLALWILATASSNNPTSQTQLLSKGLIPLLIKGFEGKTFGTPLALKRAILTCSGLIKGQKAGMVAFVAANGFREAARATFGLVTTVLGDGSDAAQVDKDDALAALKALLFVLMTVLDPHSDLPGRPEVLASIVARPVADCVCFGLRRPEDDVASYAVQIVCHVAESGESPARTVALAHLKQAGLMEAAAAAMGRVEGGTAQDRFKRALAVVEKVSC